MGQTVTGCFERLRNSYGDWTVLHQVTVLPILKNAINISFCFTNYPLK